VGAVTFLRILLSAVLIGAALCAQPPRQHEVREVVADTGMRIWSFPDDGGDRFLLMVLVGSGSRHEESFTPGIAHLLEHVLLASTQRRGKVEANLQLDQSGGDFNGYTKQDVTTYYLGCSSSSWRFAVEWLAEHVVQPGFVPRDIADEKAIVYQELDAREPHAGTLTLEKHLYPGHPLSRDIGGDKRRIEDITREELRAFYDQNYRGPNMAVGFAGRVPYDECVAAIREAFAPLPRGGAIATSDAVEPASGTTVLSGRPTKGWIYAGYHLPSGGSRETAAQLLLTGYLDLRAFEEVRESHQLSYAPSVRVAHYFDTARVFFEAEIAERSALPEVMGIVEGLFDELSDPRPTTFDSAARAVATALHVNSPSQLGPAMELSWLMRRAGESPVDLERALRRTDAADVASYAQQNFGPERRFAIANGRLGGWSVSYLSLALLLVAVVFVVDGMRGFPWMAAAHSRWVGRKVARERVRKVAHRRVDKIQPVRGDDLERSIQQFFEDEDRQDKDQPS